MINRLPHLDFRRQTAAPSVREALRQTFVQMFCWTVIVGGILYIASTSDDLQPGSGDKVQVDTRDVPKNKPSWSTHQGQARKVCKGPVVPSGEGRFADWVIVVKQNGKTVRMGLDRAARLNQNEDTNVWVIGICKRDLLDNPLD